MSFFYLTTEKNQPVNGGSSFLKLSANICTPIRVVCTASKIVPIHFIHLRCCFDMILVGENEVESRGVLRLRSLGNLIKKTP